jgi:alkanesulfonate monooxygenase SsuD/methylene tetrahydromethanopterin reductase-like flavin-dependent oxidoreductase (luciferase family)
MEIGIGLPNPIKGATGSLLIDWAKRAEERGFATLATIDRIAYPSFDSLATIAAAAGATSRIGCMTNIVLAPAYPPALLAKTTATVDQLSSGRLTLGLAPGGREDDFVAAGRDFRSRGQAFDAELDFLHRAWRGEHVADVNEAVCPRPVKDDRIPIMIGGMSDKAVQRTAQWGVGWTAGGGGVEMVAPLVERVRAAWRQAGRAGEPRLAALVYFSLGAGAESDSHAYLRDYYAHLGPYAEQIDAAALRSAAVVRDTAQAYANAGFTELYFDPTVASLDQLDRLADAVL